MNYENRPQMCRIQNGIDLVGAGQMEIYRERMRQAKASNLKILPEELAGKSKIETARNIIREALRVSKNPVVFSSFGKDSLAMLDLVREQCPHVEVVHLMDANMMHKNFHAVYTAGLLGVKMHTYPPSGTDYIQRDDYFEVLHYFYIDGVDQYCLYNGCAPYDKARPYLCAVVDLLDIPTVSTYDFRWDCIFHGQKETESVHVIDTHKIKTPIMPYGHGVLAMPLFNWSDEEVLAYGYEKDLPVQWARYTGNPSGESMGGERDTFNNDVVPTCHDCLDIANEGKGIWCPKLEQMVPYKGKTKKQHDETMALMVKKTAYIEEVANAGTIS